MKKALLAVLAASLIPSLARAQLVVSDKGLPFTGISLYYHDLASGATTGALSSETCGMPLKGVAADEAGGVLYLVRDNDRLWRWPYTDPAPTLVGRIKTSAGTNLDVRGITFGNGVLYVTNLNLCRYPIFQVDPTTAVATLLYDPTANDFISDGIGFDPSTGLLVLANRAVTSMCGPAYPQGVYTLDPNTLALTLLAPFSTSPTFKNWAHFAVGSGRVWFAEHTSPMFHNLDLATLTWDPSPPANPIVSDPFGWFGLSWSPTLVQGSSSVSYCTSGTSASGCNALLSTIGTPSATATSCFSLHATNVEGGKTGILFFGTNGRQANQWGNGTSFRCVVGPVKRAGVMAGVGTPGLCDGSFDMDFNALWSAFPGKNPGAGATVQTQLWYRDPQNPSNRTTSFSDAIEFVVRP